MKNLGQKQFYKQSINTLYNYNLFQVCFLPGLFD